MRWKGGRESSNVEDRRGRRVSKGMMGGGVGTLIVVVLYLILGGNPGQLLNQISPGASTEESVQEYQPTAEEQELAKFTSVVLAETEDVWTAIFEKEGIKYEYPKLVLFSEAVESACGVGESSTGPFYCPGDNKVYIDLSFFNELKEQYEAPGDFAMAYVIAHEVGHHVQFLLETSQKVDALRERLSEKEFNKYSVCLELQADYFAGVYAHYANRMNILEEGDLDEALNAASAIGDDRLQQEYQGRVVPDSFTHGTSAQRRNWFYKGFESGDMNGGDTFKAMGMDV